MAGPLLDFSIPPVMYKPLISLCITQYYQILSINISTVQNNSVYLLFSPTILANITEYVYQYHPIFLIPYVSDT